MKKNKIVIIIVLIGEAITSVTIIFDKLSTT